MREVKWNGRNGPVCHFLYTKAEADTINLNYCEKWRDGRLGDWVLTDDGWVVQIIRQAEDSRGRFTLGTATTTVACASKKELDVLEKADRYQIGGKARKPRNGYPRNMTAAIKVFCLLVATGKHVEDAYVEAFRGSKDPEYVRRNAKALMGLDMVQEEIKTKLGNLLEQEGISMAWILQQYKRIILEGDKDAPKVVALNKLAQFQGMDKMVEKPEELPSLPAGVEADFQITGAIEVTEDPEPKEDDNEDAEDVMLNYDGLGDSE